MAIVPESSEPVLSGSGATGVAFNCLSCKVSRREDILLASISKRVVEALLEKKISSKIQPQTS